MPSNGGPTEQLLEQSMLMSIKATKKPSEIERIAIVSAIILLAAVFVYMEFHKDSKSIRKQVNALIARAGGQDEVVREANTLFKRFSNTNFMMFKEQDVVDCQALASLGYVRGIGTDSVKSIRIRVGGHFTGFNIYIIDTNLPVYWQNHENECQIISNQIIATW